MINRWNLGNGAQLVVEDLPYVKSAAVGVYIKIGSRHEPPHLAGASHFLEHMLFKGTEQRTAREIAETMEGMGGQLNAFTSKEYTCVYARTLDEDIYAAMDIVFDMVFNSQITKRDLDTERKVIIEEINMYEDTPDDLIHDVFARKFWDGHSMGNPILGSVQSITEMDRDEMFQYYQTNYVPANMVISVAGNIDGDRVRDYLGNKLASHKGTAPLFEKTKPQLNGPFMNLVAKDVEQMQICLGVPGLSYHEKERYTQNVMNSILGGGMSSRLFQRLREELGLAYSVYSYPASYSDTGLFSIYIGTSPARVDQFCGAFFEEMERFKKEGVSEEEVSRTQKLMKSSISLGLESVMNRMTRLGKAVLMYNNIVTPEEIIEKIYTVKPHMVQEMAERLFKPELFSIAAIGGEEHLPLVEKEYKQRWGKKDAS